MQKRLFGSFILLITIPDYSRWVGTQPHYSRWVGTHSDYSHWDDWVRTVLFWGMTCVSVFICVSVVLSVCGSVCQNGSICCK